MDLNARIQKIIEYSMLTASEFADEIGVNRPNISHILSGRNKASLDLVMKIKERFPEIQWEWIIEGKGDMILPLSPTPSKITGSKINEEEKNLISQPLDLFSFNEFQKEEDKKDAKQDNISNPSELNILNLNTNQEKIEHSQRLEINEISISTNRDDFQENEIEKIIFFYKNGKFKIFEP